MKNWFKKNSSILLLLSTLVLITYINSLNNAFLSDDLAEIVNNPNIGNSMLAITTHPFGFIRPVLYSIIFNIAGLNQVLFRLSNVFFHIGSVFLIYAIFSYLFSKRLALIVAGIFAVHPAISEAVVWISGGGYPQYTFFFLLSFLFYILAAKRKSFYLLSSVFYLLSFMSHPQMPLALFLIFPLYELSFGPPAGGLKKNWKKSIPFLLITIAFLLLAVAALPERETTLQSVHYQEKGIDNPLVLIPAAISSYLELIFFPQTLTLYHSELNFGPINFALRSLITIIFFALIGLSFKKNKFVFFWLSFFVIALAPTLTPFRLNWIVAERYIYLPSIGIFASVAYLLDYFAKKKKYRYIIFTVLFLIITLLSVRTIIRNIDWKNEDNLWIATGKTSPSSPNTHNNLGDVYGRQGDKAGALREFQTAIALKPNYADAYHNLANTYAELKQPDKALENYQSALKFNPNLWQSYQNIAALHYNKAKQATGSAEITQQEYNLALENVQKAILINPRNINLRMNLGIVYLSMGEKAKAKEIFNLVLLADPQNQLARAGLAEASK